MQLADVLGASQRNVRTWLAQGMPAAVVEGRGPVPALFNVPRCTAWWRERTGADKSKSEGLERLRQAKAGIEELKLAIRRGEVCDVVDVNAVIDAFVRGFHEACRRFQAEHPEAIKLFTDFLEMGKYEVDSMVKAIPKLKRESA